MKLNYKDCGKIGFTCSTFDLLHAGHITMLEEAKHHCDYLIVGLQNDPTLDRPEKNAPVQTIVERQLQLAAVKYVDEIVIYNTEQDLVDLLLTLPKTRLALTTKLSATASAASLFTTILTSQLTNTASSLTLRTQAIV